MSLCDEMEANKRNLILTTIILFNANSCKNLVFFQKRAFSGMIKKKHGNCFSPVITSLFFRYCQLLSDSGSERNYLQIFLFWLISFFIE
jgi:hypothetical protein